MFVLAVIVAVLAVIFGAATLLVSWPLAVVAAAVLYCLDRPARRRAWPPTAGLIGAAAIAFYLAVDDVRPSSLAKVLVFVVPLLVAAATVLAAGGPRRIRLRHERAEAERKRVRAEAKVQRRRARKDSFKTRTGVDVDLLAGATRDRAGRLSRAVGGRLTRRRRTPDGPVDLLDLDQDVSSEVSRAQREEINRLAAELDRHREK